MGTPNSGERQGARAWWDACCTILMRPCGLSAQRSPGPPGAALAGDALRLCIPPLWSWGAILHPSSGGLLLLPSMKPGCPGPFQEARPKQLCGTPPAALPRRFPPSSAPTGVSVARGDPQRPPCPPAFQHSMSALRVGAASGVGVRGATPDHHPHEDARARWAGLQAPSSSPCPQLTGFHF